MKDLKHLLEQDNENSAAKTEYAEVKQLWEKQLRHLQATNQQQGKKPSKKKTKQHKNKESAKERNQTTQQSQLEQLLAETKAKKDRLKKESIELSSKENPSEYLSAGKTTYYKPPETTAKRRRKVVVEEEEEAKGGGQEGGAGPKEAGNEEAGPKEGGNEEAGPREGGNEEGDHHTITGDTKNARKVGDGKLVRSCVVCMHACMKVLYDCRHLLSLFNNGTASLVALGVVKTMPHCSPQSLLTPSLNSSTSSWRETC